MSLIDELMKTAGDKGPDWVGRALDKAEELARGKLEEAYLLPALDGLAQLRAIAPQLAGLGHAGLVSIIAKVYVGDRESATNEYLASGAATLEELRKALQQGTADAVAARVRIETDWETVYAVIVGLGNIALRLLPFILASAA